jgi:hypothetical protein
MKNSLYFYFVNFIELSSILLSLFKDLKILATNQKPSSGITFLIKDRSDGAFQKNLIRKTEQIHIDAF